MYTQGPNQDSHAPYLPAQHRHTVPKYTGLGTICTGMGSISAYPCSLSTCWWYLSPY